MPRDAPFDFVGQASIRTADQVFDVAAARLISTIEDAAQNATNVLTASSYSSVDGIVPFHASAYRELKTQLQTKLNDGSIAWTDSKLRNRLASVHQTADDAGSPSLNSTRECVRYSAARICTGTGRANRKNSFSALEINASWRWTKTVVILVSASGTS